MRKAIKTKGKSVFAYRLGDRSAVVEQLMREGKIAVLENGDFEIFSQEAVNGGSGHGQVANADDYVKIDSMGYPYPNDAEFFAANHRHIAGDEYEQLPKELDAWTEDEPMCPEIEFLVREKGLLLDETDPARYFSALLWGTMEAAAKDAVLIFYHIDRDAEGAILDAEFNFVERSEFEKTYRFC